MYMIYMMILTKSLGRSAMSREIVEDNLDQYIKSANKSRYKLDKIKTFYVLVFMLFIIGVIVLFHNINLNNNKQKSEAEVGQYSDDSNNVIKLKPGYYYSKYLGLVIKVPQHYYGEERNGKISLESDSRKGLIKLEREYTQYSSLEEALNNTNNELLKSAERFSWNSLDNKIHGISVEIDNPKAYYYNYYFYRDHFIYNLLTNSIDALPDYFDIANELQFSSVPITPTPNVRKSYDFVELLNENFLALDVMDAGYSIEHPSEMEVGKFRDQNEAIYLSLISQTQKETEVYDGLLIKIFYYENINNELINIIKDKKNKKNDEYDWTKVENIIVNGNNGWKIIQCCYMGESYQYFFLTKNGRKYIRIDIYSNGPDSSSYEKIIDRMINSLKFI